MRQADKFCAITQSWVQALDGGEGSADAPSSLPLYVDIPRR